jgi:DNA end-binding protein Ku
MAARSTGSGTISFGLVSIPIKMYTATSSHHIGFHLLHRKCGTRLKQQYMCPYDKEIVDRADMVRGFEHARERYVEISDEELDAVRLERTDRIDILEFVPADTVDFLYIDKTYFLGPDRGGGRAYKLLSDAMERAGRIAVGRYGARGKDQLVLLRPYRSGLVMHQVYYADEVRSMDEVPQPGRVEFKPMEEELADRLVQQLSADAFHPEKYHDEYQERLLAAIERKVQGQEITAPPERPEAQIIDLFEALKRSLGEKQPAAAEPARHRKEAAPAEEEEAAERPALKKAAPRRPREKKTGTSG